MPAPWTVLAGGCSREAAALKHNPLLQRGYFGEPAQAGVIRATVWLTVKAQVGNGLSCQQYNLYIC